MKNIAYKRGNDFLDEVLTSLTKDNMIAVSGVSYSTLAKRFYYHRFNYHIGWDAPKNQCIVTIKKKGKYG